MIPIHDISESDKKVIRMNELVSLTHYDSSEAHRHNYFEFFVFLKGGGIHVIDFVDFPIKSNSIHIVAPGQVHQVKRELDSNGFVFIFEMNQFQSNKLLENFLMDQMCLDVNEFSPTYSFDPVFDEELNFIVSNAWKEYSSNRTFKDQLVFNQLSLLIVNCMQTKIDQNVELDPKNSGIYISFRRMLSTEFRTIKKVKEYAEALFVSEKQLNEIIQQRTGETASSLIYKQLILEAKRLLNTGMQAKEVSYELNFIDPGHFSKFFKTQTGLSPSDFRNIHA